MIIALLSDVSLEYLIIFNFLALLSDSDVEDDEGSVAGGPPADSILPDISSDEDEGVIDGAQAASRDLE